MGIELAIGISAVIVTFIISCSIIMNLVLLVASVFSFIFIRSAIKENTLLQNEMADLDSQLIVSDSVNGIIEHIITLRDELVEIVQMDVYTGEPIIEGLLVRVSATLEKIESSVINQEYLKSRDE